MGVAKCARLLLAAWLPLCLACGDDADSAPEGGGTDESAAPAVDDADTGAGGADGLPASADDEEAADPEDGAGREDAAAAGVEAAAGVAAAADSSRAPAPSVDTIPFPEGDSLPEGEAPAVEMGENPDSLPAALPDVLIPAGTQIRVVGEDDISTADHFVDDPVVATVWEDVTGTDGTVLIPAGTRMLGRVLASVGSGGAGEAPVLELAFETLSSWRYERPIEGAVVEALVVLDPAGDFERRRAGDRRAAVTMVPAKIMAGSVIVVELRAPVLVTPFPALPDSLMPNDMLMPGDTLVPSDARIRRDTLIRRDTVVPADPARYSG